MELESYFEITEDVLEIATDLIEKYHSDLLDCRVGFIFKAEATRTNGREVWGKAEKVSEKNRAAGVDYDFLIWIAHDIWMLLDSKQKRALVDHELCHCRYDDIEDKTRLRPHDVEEFGEIIERYGFWKADLQKLRPYLAQALQMELPGLGERKHNGGVVKANVKKLATITPETVIPK